MSLWPQVTEYTESEMKRRKKKFRRMQVGRVMLSAHVSLAIYGTKVVVAGYGTYPRPMGDTSRYCYKINAREGKFFGAGVKVEEDGVFTFHKLEILTDMFVETVEVLDDNGYVVYVKHMDEHFFYSDVLCFTYTLDTMKVRKVRRYDVPPHILSRLQG